MKFKKIMLLIMIISSLSLITAVSAVDNVTDNIYEVEYEIMDMHTNAENPIVNNSISEDSLSTSNEMVITNSPGTFTDLANEINDAYREFELTRNYYYSSDLDNDYNGGIVINKQLVINGNGFKIDGGNEARAFDVEYDNVEIKNIQFTNCIPPYSSGDYYYSTGGAICWNGNDGILDNCDFTNCYTKPRTSSSSSYTESRGGAVFWSANNGIINNCKFIDCYSTVSGSYRFLYAWGGAVYMWGDYGKICNSYFENCRSYSSSMQSDCDGGAIFWRGNDGIVDNSVFYNCYASATGERSSAHAGAIAITGKSVKISNCNFNSNYADNYGGAIASVGANGKIIDCTFDSNYAGEYGGAISVYATACTLENSRFYNNYADDNLSKAVSWESENGSIINSNIYQKPVPVMVVPPLDKASSDGSVKINLPRDATGNITLTINKKNYSYRVNKGVAKIIIPNLNEGNYPYTIIYSGNEKYSSVIYNGNLNFRILSTTILASGITTVYNGGKYLVITLKDENGDVIKDTKMNIVFNDKKINPKTNSKGQVKISLNNLAPKSYTATIIFEGTIIHTNSFKIAKVIIKKATPKLIAKAKTFKKSVKTKNFAVTLKTNQNKLMKNTKITLNVNGKTYSATTNSKGQATFKITKLTKKGGFTATIKYAGSKYYNAKIIKAKITVK